MYSDYLRDIAHYAETAEQFVAGLDYEQFAAYCGRCLLSIQGRPQMTGHEGS